MLTDTKYVSGVAVNLGSRRSGGMFVTGRSVIEGRSSRSTPVTAPTRVGRALPQPMAGVLSNRATPSLVGVLALVQSRLRNRSTALPNGSPPSQTARLIWKRTSPSRISSWTAPRRSRATSAASRMNS